MPGSSRPASATSSSGRGATSWSASTGSTSWSGCSLTAPVWRRGATAAAYGRGVSPSVLPVAADARVPDLLEHLAAALAGAGPALLPLPGGAADVPLRAAAALHRPAAAGTALLLATSGSTGAPRVVELGAEALAASATAAHARLGGPGQWLLALPLVHVAGWQVLVRSVVAGTAPVVAGSAGRGTAAGVGAAARRMGGRRRYAALVPTQLARVLEDRAATRALAGLDAVLVGGAAASGALLAAARSAGVRVVTTYGGTETAGGCVYDGVPLDGVRAGLEQGRVVLAGPVLARGYRGLPELSARAFPGAGPSRRHLTADLGRLVPGPGGRPLLQVLGRADDVLVTGGEKVAPLAVEEVLAGLDGVRAALVVGVPDPEWGQAVVALVVPAAAGAAPGLESARAAVRERLGAASAPRHLVVVEALPALAVGKPDRRAAAALAARRLGAEPLDARGSGSRQ